MYWHALLLIADMLWDAFVSESVLWINGEFRLGLLLLKVCSSLVQFLEWFKDLISFSALTNLLKNHISTLSMRIINEIMLKATPCDMIISKSKHI